MGLLGANGSGRTTLLELLATLIRPSSGSLDIDGVDAVRRPYDARRKLAYVGGQRDVRGQGLCVDEYAAFVLSMRRDRRISSQSAEIGDALTRAGLAPAADVDHLSAGQRRRLSLTLACLIRPRVLLLDDPLAGLDGDARTAFAVWLSEARDAGTTIVAALNEERDVRVLCQRTIRLEAGRLATAAAMPAADRLRVAPKPASAAV